MKRVFILILVLGFSAGAMLSQDKVASADSTKMSVKKEQCDKDCCGNMEGKKESKKDKAEKKENCRMCKSKKAETKP